MLFSVFRDLRPFLLFFGIVIIFFSMILAVLLKDDLNNYEALGPVVYFIIAMRESIGDFDTDDSIINNSDYKVLIWLFYFMILIIGNVVFMNFIIAVVNQSYENCMQQSLAQSYKVKLHMISERESIMSESEYKNKEWFPNFIILCKPITEGINEERGNKDGNGVAKELE
jgi:hypothetical protein